MNRTTKTLRTLLSIGLVVVSFCGCSTTANLYPVKGPLSEVKPLPVIRARVDGIMGNYTVGNKPGENRGQAIVIGERGTVIEVEFYTGSGTANGFGLAKDNKGNIYKVLF